jgi:hypothetical protein
LLERCSVLAERLVVDCRGLYSRRFGDEQTTGRRDVGDDQYDFGGVVFVARRFNQRRHVGAAAGNQNGDAFAAHRQARSRLPL